jgi:type II secretory pathway component PulC
MRMFDSLDALPTRARQNGPLLLSLALSALIAVELGRASMVLLIHPSEPPRLEPQRASRPMRRPQLDVRKIAAAHLFGVFKDPAAPGSQEPRATTANLILAGTIATEDPNHGVAIIAGLDTPSKVYWVGQEVSGALLRSVYLDHVLLDRNGSLEILALPKPVGRPGAPAGAPTLTAQDGSSLDDAPAQEGSMRLALSNIGGRRGFRVVGGKALAALRASGLTAIDVVTAINGSPIDENSPQQSIDEAQGPLVVTVMRRGHATNIKVNLGEDD